MAAARSAEKEPVFWGGAVIRSHEELSEDRGLQTHPAAAGAAAEAGADLDALGAVVVVVVALDRRIELVQVGADSDCSQLSG